MKYVKQFLIILAISLIGEMLNFFIPLPVPASIYGILILFVCLQTRVIKLSQVSETGKFLIEIMPIMFIPAAVGIIDSWDLMRDSVIEYIILLVVSTIVVMVCSGLVTQLVIKHEKTRGGKR